VEADSEQAVPEPPSEWEGDEPAERDEWYQNILGSLPEPSDGSLFPIKLLEGFAGAVARIEAYHPDQASAVVVRALGAEGWPPASRSREEILTVLFGDFLAAHHQATQIARQRWQAAIRHQLSAIAMEILRLLGSEVQRIDETLAIVARRLREPPFSYHRVLLSLIDPTEEMIVGTYEESDDPQKTMRQRTQYPLNAPDRSLHARAIHERRPGRFSDLARELGANRETIQQTGARAGAVIPLLFVPADDPSRPIPLGTLWCERTDQLPPSQAEVQELEEFGKKLAVVLVQSKRVQLLQSAFDQQRQPILVLDAKDRPVFANDSAIELTGRQIPKGWRNYDIDAPNPLNGPPSSQFVRELRKAIGKTRERRRRLVSHFDIGTLDTGGSLRQAPRYSEWISLLTDAIPYCAPPDVTDGPDHRSEWRGPVEDWELGVVAEGQRLAILYRIFEALRRLHRSTNRDQPDSRTSRMEAIINDTGSLLTEILGHRYALLYRLDLADPTAMELERIYATPEELHRFHKFRRITLAPGRGWLCFDAKAPVVLSFDEGRPDGEGYSTDSGLDLHNLHDPALRPFLEQYGETIWIEFPIFLGSKPLGMFVLECRDSYLPEDFEFLKAFASLLASLLEGVNKDDHLHLVSLMEIQHNSYRDQHFLIHPIKKVLIVLRDKSKTKKAREDGEGSHAEFLASVRRITQPQIDYLEAVGNKLSQELKLACQRVDLIALVRTLLMQEREKFDWSLEFDPSCHRDIQTSEWRTIDAHPGTGSQETVSRARTVNGEPFYVHLDPEMQVVLRELFQNAQENYAGNGRLRIQFRIREVPGWPTRVQLRIQDNGPGIKPEMLKDNQLFLLYKTSRENGTGLGLAHARDIVMAHGGWISAQNELGGATFVIELPRFQLSPTARESSV
jgi:signal transduction histidine kinase/PAS domain-containing protein